MWINASMEWKALDLRTNKKIPASRCLFSFFFIILLKAYAIVPRAIHASPRPRQRLCSTKKKKELSLSENIIHRSTLHQNGFYIVDTPVGPFQNNVAAAIALFKIKKETENNALRKCLPISN